MYLLTYLLTNFIMPLSFFMLTKQKSFENIILGFKLSIYQLSYVNDMDTFWLLIISVEYHHPANH